MRQADPALAVRADLGEEAHTPRVLLALGGPLLIVVCVLIVLHDVAFGGMIPSQHEDILTHSLPDHCFLGGRLAAGDLPTWNPHVMGGVPFAADPQSGWLLLPAMLLYTALRCDVAVRWYFVLQPVLAGLGIYWFLRSERVSRLSSTLGGLVLSLGLSGSFLVASLPFSGTLAWTSVTLAAVSRYVRADTWSKRLIWAGLSSLAWGQIAATHLSNGLIIGTTAILAFLLSRLIADVLKRRRSLRSSLVLVGIILISLPLVNAALLLPRVAYLPRTSISIGYARLQELNSQLPGAEARPFVAGRATVAAWPLKLATSPGTYLGAMPLVFAVAALWTRRRQLAIAFGVFGLTSYVIALEGVARTVSPIIRSWPFADFYLHRPWRFSVGVLLSMAVLSALGLEAFRMTRPWRTRAFMLAPGVLVWGVLPLVAGANRASLALLGLGALAGIVVLSLSFARPVLLVALPIVVALELSANGLLGQETHEPGRYWRRYFGLGKVTFGTVPLQEPNIPVAEYMEQGPMARSLQDGGVGRYVTRGNYVYMLQPWEWPGMAAQRSTLFGLEDAQGYNPTQLKWYWTYVRSVNTRRVKYNMAILTDPAPTTLDLLNVRWLVASSPSLPGPEWEQRAVDGVWALYERPGAPPRASLITAWSAMPSDEALHTVMSADFDSSRQVILERHPGIPRAGSPGGAARYFAPEPDSVRVDVTARVPAVLLIRNVYDPGWRVEIDGRPARLLRADYFLQAVAVPAGTHTVVLAHDDPWIGRGLAVSLVSLALLVSAAALSARMRARRLESASAASDEEPQPTSASPSPT